MGGKGKSGGSSRKCVLHHVKTQNSVPDSATGTQELAPPQPGADMLDWKEYLDYQLNSLREYEFLGGLVMLFGPKTRLHGGSCWRSYICSISSPVIAPPSPPRSVVS